VNVVGVEDLDEFNLDPAHYRADERLDLEALTGERASALEDLRSARDRATVAMDRLLEQLEVQP
jgi:hypothetical protein